VSRESRFSGGKQRERRLFPHPYRKRKRSPRTRENGMIRHVLLRFLYSLPALWLILTMVFLLVHIVPGDPVLQMLGQDAARGRSHTIAPRRWDSISRRWCKIRAIPRGAGAQRLGQIAAFCGAGAPDRLSRFPRRWNYPWRIDCLHWIAVPAGVFSAKRRAAGRPRDLVLHSARPFSSQTCARARADSDFFRGDWMAACFGARWRQPSDPACHYVWARRWRRF